MTDRHPDNELRRRLWMLADEWDKVLIDPVTDHNFRVAAQELRKALTYPAATEADEAELVTRYGKTSDELADEAEKGHDS